MSTFASRSLRAAQTGSGIARRLRLLAFGLLAAAGTAPAATYFVDSQRGDDAASGTTAAQAWRSLARASRAELRPGDRLALATGATHAGVLRLENRAGTADAPIVLTSFAAGGGAGGEARIDGRGQPAALHLRNCRHLTVENLVLTADGGG